MPSKADKALKLAQDEEDANLQEAAGTGQAVERGRNRILGDKPNRPTVELPSVPSSPMNSARDQSAADRVREAGGMHAAAPSLSDALSSAGAALASAQLPGSFQTQITQPQSPEPMWPDIFIKMLDESLNPKPAPTAAASAAATKFVPPLSVPKVLCMA